jgi:hypothetical protein
VNPLDPADHFGVVRYGDFVLTEAVRPARHLPVVPREGFRLGVYREIELGLEVPVMAAAVSRDKLFDAFLSLMRPLPGIVDVVLETSHHSTGGNHFDLLREEIELPVLLSHLCDEEELLMDDGCTGVAIIAAEAGIEVQFDEHKLLVVYAPELEPFEAALRQIGVPRVDGLKLITEGEHLHSTLPEYAERFERLCARLGITSGATA